MANRRHLRFIDHDGTPHTRLDSSWNGFQVTAGVESASNIS